MAVDIAALEIEFAKNPGVDTCLPLCTAYLASKRYTEAMVVCKKTLKTAAPDDLRGRIMLARIYLEQGKLPKAEQEINQVLQIAQPAAGLEMQGRVYLEQGRTHEAIEAFQQALAKDPSLVFARAQVQAAPNIAAAASPSPVALPSAAPAASPLEPKQEARWGPTDDSIDESSNTVQIVVPTFADDDKSAVTAGSAAHPTQSPGSGARSAAAVPPTQLPGNATHSVAVVPPDTLLGSDTSPGAAVLPQHKPSDHASAKTSQKKLAAAKESTAFAASPNAPAKAAPQPVEGALRKADLRSSPMLEKDTRRVAKGDVPKFAGG